MYDIMIIIFYNNIMNNMIVECYDLVHTPGSIA